MEKELFYYLENSITQTTCVVISSNNQDSTVVRSTRITNVHLSEVSNSIDDSLFHMHVFSVRLLSNFFRAFSFHALSKKITERLSTYHPDRNSPFKWSDFFPLCSLLQRLYDIGCTTRLGLCLLESLLKFCLYDST